MHDDKGRQVIYDKGGVLSTINALLKDDELTNEIQDLVNRSTFLLSQIKKERTTHGRQFIFPVQLGVSQGVGARGENVILPDPGFGEYEQALGQVKYLYSTMYITGQSISATQNNRTAFADALKQSMKDARDGLTLDMQRQVWGDGSGVIGRVAASGTTDVVAVTDPYGLTYIQSDLDNAEKTRLFRRNMNLFIAGANVFARVVAVNGNGTVRLNQAVTVTAGNLIYRGDATGRTSVNNEVTGITGFMQTTGTYLGLSRDGHPEWQANVLQLGTGSGGGITEEMMRIAIDTASINGNAEPDLIVTNHKTRRRFEMLLQGQRRFVNPMQLQGGYSALEYDGKPLMVDRDAPPQRMFFLRMADISWMVMEDVQWMNRDGAPLKWVNDKDAYKAVLFTYRELVTRRPANQTVLFDITTAPAE
jgi:hypothetical protein